MTRLVKTIAAVALCASAGCFNEPEPAYKTVPAGSRAYLQDRCLSDLASADLSKVGDYLNLDRNQLTNVTPVAALAGSSGSGSTQPLSSFPTFRSCRTCAGSISAATASRPFRRN